MTTRLLAIALFIPLAVLFALGCSSDDTKDNQGVSIDTAQGVATVVAPLTALTPELRQATPPAPSDSAPNAVITPAPPPSSLPPSGATPAAPAPPSGSTISVAFPFTDAP